MPCLFGLIDHRPRHNRHSLAFNGGTTLALEHTPYLVPLPVSKHWNLRPTLQRLRSAYERRGDLLGIHFKDHLSGEGGAYF